MSCKENEMLIHGYLDGELDLLNTVKLEDHLRECSACAQHTRISRRCGPGSAAGLYFKARIISERVHLALKKPTTPRPTLSLRPGVIGTNAIAAVVEANVVAVLVGMAGVAEPWPWLHWLSGGLIPGSRGPRRTSCWRRKSCPATCARSWQSFDRRAVFGSAYGEAVV